MYICQKLNDMIIVMKEGVEVTLEIEVLARSYDFYTAYIENSGQREKAEEKNRKIMEQLKALGVKSIRN